MTDKTIQKANPTVDDVDALVRRTMFANQPADLVNMTLLICQRYDLDPLLKHVVLIKGNIYVTRDGLLHVAHQSGQLNGMHVTLGKDDFGMFAECTIYRRDMEHPFTYRVYRDEYDSKTGAWRTHPRAMLIKTAEVFTLRRAFDVALTPIEEMDTVIDRHQPDPPSPSIATQGPPSPSIATQGPPSPSIATQARPVEGEVVKEGGPEPKPHWIDNPKARTKFWVYTKNDLGLTEEQVYEALGVKSIHDFDGTMQQAKDKLDTYADALHNAPPDEPKPCGKPKQLPTSAPPPWAEWHDEPLFPDQPEDIPA